MAFIHYRTKGIFLKKTDIGEADRLFTVYTRDFGKLDILARAIRKIKSKLRGASDIFYLSEIEFIQGRVYKTLTDALLIKKFKNLRRDNRESEFARNLADNLDLLLREEEKDEKIWRLLIETLENLNSQLSNQSINNSQLLLYYYFLWNLFSVLGYAPQLYSCPVCSKKLLPETFWFVNEEGGVVCWHCFKKFSQEKQKTAREISVDTVKVLRIFLKENSSVLKKIKLEKEAQDNLREVSESYLNYLKSDFQKTENNIK